MALENFLGYSFDEVNSLHNGKISKDLYEMGAKHLKNTYEQMMARLHQRLARHSKHYIAQSTTNSTLSRWVQKYALLSG